MLKILSLLKTQKIKNNQIFVRALVQIDTITTELPELFYLITFFPSYC